MKASNKTNEDPIRYGISQLLMCGIDIYTKLGNSDTFVIDDGSLNLCAFKRVTLSAGYSRLSLTEQDLGKFMSVTGRYNYICAIDVTGQRVWLLPTMDVALSKTITLTKKYDEYILRYNRVNRLKQIELDTLVHKENVQKIMAEKLNTLTTDDLKDEVISLLDRNLDEKKGERR